MASKLDTQSGQPFYRNSRFWLALVIIVGLFLVIFFGFRAVRSFIRLQRAGLQPGSTNVEAIRGWMTVDYLAKNYDVPEQVILEGLEIPVDGNQQASLSQLNRQYYPDKPQFVIERARQVIGDYLSRPLPQETAAP